MQLGHPFMVIRAMSDTADHAANISLMNLSLRLANALPNPDYLLEEIGVKNREMERVS